MIVKMQACVPGYRLLNEPQFDPPSLNSGGQALVTTFVEVEGAEKSIAAVCRQPRHHDGGGHRGQRGDRQRNIVCHGRRSPVMSRLREEQEDDE